MSTITTEREIKKNGCRNLHYSVHSPSKKVYFCTNCKDYCEAISEQHKQCACCKKSSLKIEKYLWLTRALHAGIKQHRKFLRDWLMFPSDVKFKTLKNPYIVKDMNGKKITVKEVFIGQNNLPQYLEIAYKGIVYEMEAKYLALALENPKVHEILPLIKQHIWMKGIRIIIPEEEKMDETCTRCKADLVYNKFGVEFCKNCDK